MFKFFNNWRNQGHKTLARVQQGLRLSRSRSIFDRQLDKRVTTTTELVELWKSWVYICSKQIGSRTGSATLRLYAVQGRSDDTILVPHKVLSKKEVKNLRKHNPRFKSLRMRSDEVVVEIIDHPFIELMKRPSEQRTQYEFFDETTQFSECTGDAYWYMEKDPFGRPLHLYILPTQLVVPVVGTGDTWIKEYRFGKGEDAVIFRPDEIVHFRLANLENQYVGRSRTEAVMAAVQLNNEAKAYNLALNQNDAVPSTVISLTDPTADGKTATKFKRQYDKIMRGISKSGKTFVHTGEIKIEKLGQSIKDMQYIEGQKFVRVEILASFGVPEGIVYAENVNKSNKAEDHFTFEKFTIKPKLLNYEDKLNAEVIPLYGDPSLFCAFDENVPRDQEFEEKKTNNMWNSGRITRNEARERDDYPPLDGPEGDVFVLIGGLEMDAGESDENTDLEEENENQGVI